MKLYKFSCPLCKKTFYCLSLTQCVFCARQHVSTHKVHKNVVKGVDLEADLTKYIEEKEVR